MISFALFIWLSLHAPSGSFVQLRAADWHCAKHRGGVCDVWVRNDY